MEQMTIWLFCLLSLQMVHSTSVLHITDDNGSTRINGVQDHEGKDIIIGGLFTIHHDAAGSAGSKCHTRVFNQGLETLEAMFYSLDQINNDPDLLPNIKLGYDIRDTCESANIALDESVSLAFEGSDAESYGCNCGSTGNASNLLPVAATIGPLESFVTIPVASFFRVFQMPQVSYGSTSTTLNNRNQYGYFFRTIPPDNAQVMIDFILYYKWDHISTIYSHNGYGEPYNNEFLQLAHNNNICIDVSAPIRDNFRESDYKNLVQLLLFNTTANVVVLLAATDHTTAFLQELKNIMDRNGHTRKFIWIAPDASFQPATDFKEFVAGMWGITTLSDPDPSFNDYFLNLSPSTNLRNPWYNEYYTEYQRNTSSDDYKQFVLVPCVIDAVYSIAHAIHDFLIENCQQPVVWLADNQTCVGQEQIFNGRALLPYIQRVNFTSSSGYRLNFDENGNIEGRFKIQNFQIEDWGNRTLKVADVFFWDEHNGLQKYPNQTGQFGYDKESGNIRYEFKSQCKACSIGHINHKVVSSCCGACDPCIGRNYTNSTLSTSCDVCPDNMWGNRPLEGSSSCVPIQESYLHFNEPFAIVLMVLAIIGLILVVFVTGSLIYFWNRPIIKSSGREQMILILVGVVTCFMITAVYLIRPSPAICTFQRAGLWFCFSLILSALLVKLVRISRIFMHKSVSKRPRFITPKYQILFTFVLVGIQMILVVVSLIIVYPAVTKNNVHNEANQNDFPSLVVQCRKPHKAMTAIFMVYYSILLIASNALAVLTIKFPQNFNESKYVAFSTFALGLVWIAFIFTYLNTADKFQTAVIAFAIQVSAMAVLLCLFAPRIFIACFLSEGKANFKFEKEQGNSTGQEHEVHLTEVRGTLFNTKN